MCISLCLLCTILEWHIHDFVVLIPMMVLLYICFWFRKLLTNTAPIIFSRSGEREGRISRLRALQPAPPDASTMPVAEPLHAQRNQYSFFFFQKERNVSHISVTRNETVGGRTTPENSPNFHPFLAVAGAPCYPTTKQIRLTATKLPFSTQHCQC